MDQFFDLTEPSEIETSLCETMNSISSCLSHKDFHDMNEMNLKSSLIGWVKGSTFGRDDVKIESEKMLDEFNSFVDLLVQVGNKKYVIETKYYPPQFLGVPTLGDYPRKPNTRSDFLYLRGDPPGIKEAFDDIDGADFFEIRHYYKTDYSYHSGEYSLETFEFLWKQALDQVAKYSRLLSAAAAADDDDPGEIYSILVFGYADKVKIDVTKI